MKRLLSGILICALALTLGVSGFADAAVSLSDVQPGSWYYNEVSEMVAAGFIDGYEDGTFQPDRTVTVAEAVTMTARMTGAATGATEEHWAGVQMENAYRSGWITEDDVPRSSPDMTVSRELACKIIAAALGLSYPAGTVLPFTDSDSIGNSYLSSVMALYANGLLDGYEDGTLRPQATLTRAQAATLLYRAVHSGDDPDDNYISAEGFTAAQITDYFCDVALEVEYGETDHTVIKWDRPIYYYISGAATETDLAQITALTDAHNGITGFPGISAVDSAESANLIISFVDSAGMLSAAGDNFNGYVTVSWSNSNITSGSIYYSTDISQELRSAVIVEELCQSLGLLNDTYDYPESIFYQYHTETDWPTSLDWAIIELLYRTEIRPGMDESAVRTAAADIVR